MLKNTYNYIKKKIALFFIGGTVLAAGVVGTVDLTQPEIIPAPSVAIVQMIESKTVAEKSAIKSREIAKKEMRGEYQNSKYGVRVEIIGKVNEININGQTGVEVFARAWRGTKQLGFGKDGSVEIERFRIFNPPILVTDDNGDVVRDYTDRIEHRLIRSRFREDPIEAIRQDIAHTVSVVGKENTKIVVGKVGNTTSTFYPVAGANSPVDVYCERASATSYADTRNGTGTTCSATDTNLYFTQNEVDAGTYIINRDIILFNTSTINTDTIDSATLSFYRPTAGIENDSGGISASIVSSAPASNNAIVTADYEIANWGTTKFATDKTQSDFTLDAYSDFTLNSDGLNNINKTGISKFGQRPAQDLANTTPTVRSYMAVSSADVADTPQDPKLVVVHSAVASASSIESDLILFE